MRWGRSCYISMFACSHGKIFLMGWIKENSKFKNTRRKGTHLENSKKQEEKNGGEKKKRFLSTWRFPYSCVLHWSGTPSGLCPCGTIPQENPLEWEPPLQHVHPCPGFSARGYGKLVVGPSQIWS